MRKLILVLLLAASAFGQGIRIGDQTPTVEQQTIGGYPGILQVAPNAKINFCNSPANGVPCTNYATTYTDATLSVACSVLTQVTLYPTTTCSANSDSNGNWGVWVSPGSYAYTVTVGGQSFGPFPALAAVPTSGTASFQVLNNVCIANAYGGFTDASIQAAINACPDGGEVYMPAGTYTMCSSLPIVINRRITLHGAGFNTWLQVCSSASATTDVITFRASNSTAVQGIHVYDFEIVAQSGVPGRYGISFDGVNGGSSSNAEIDHIWIGQLGTAAIGVINSAPIIQGNPFTTTFHDNMLFGGANMANMGDNVVFKNNVFPGTGSIVIQGRTGANDGGPHGFHFEGNNVTLSGMLQLVNCWGAAIGPGNNFEQASAGGAAAIDLQGNAATPGPPQNVVIFNNHIGGITNGVRVDRAVGTKIIDNYIVQGATAAILTTANADRTYFGYNRIAPDGTINVFLSDSGTNTSGDFIDQSTGQVNHYGPIATQNAAGTRGAVINQNAIVINPTNGIFAASSGDPGGTSPDTTLFRVGPNAWGVGSAFNTINGQFDAGNFQAQTGYKTSFGTMLFSTSAAPTISSGFGTSPSIAAHNGATTFQINVGTGGVATSGVIGMPTATTGWNCMANDVTTPANLTRQSGGTASTVTITNYNSAGTATAWTASDNIKLICAAY